ncbi:MAG: DNA repair protein RecO [Thiobacillaceae bacterium]|jgi:DNA repair protein RecO (recombination protein O)|nr:DNA repair protein RecO [Thiobacillaceae bacterium]
MADRIDAEPAYILHTYPWKETSLIVEAFTAHHGRVSLVARGARRAHSALKAKLLAFQPLWLSWFGKGGLKTLHAAEWQGGALHLSGRALMCGFYISELILKLLPPDDPHEALYRRYEETLAELSAADPQPVLRRFELDLLSELGYAQTLDQTAAGTPVEAGGRYAYTLGVGVSPAAPDAPVYAGGSLLAMAARDFSDPRTLAEAKQLMRALINHYLGDKPLHTRQLLLDLQAL